MTVNCGPILVVDDDAGVRDLVAEVLERAGFSVQKLASGHEALRAAEEEKPALVLLDVNLGRETGYTVCADLRRMYADDVAIIFVSGTRTESYDRVAGLMIGADDYIVKPFDPDELVARVRRFCSRSPRQPAVPGGPERGTSTTSASVLTPREDGIMCLLLEGLNQNQIANQLAISPKTVSTHIQRILQKLGVHSRAEAVAFAARAGLGRRVDEAALATSRR